MKKFKIKYVVFVVLLAFLIVPMIVFGESSSIESGGGSGAGNSTNDSNKWGYYYGPGGEGGHMVAGIRMTVVDQNGKMVSGTHSVDFVNYPTIKSAGIKMNSKSSRQKNAVIESDISWKKNGNTYIEKMPLKASIKFDSDSNLKINNGYVDTYFKKLAATKNNDGTTSLYTNYIVRTGYNRDNYSNYNKHYILVEPTTAIVYKGTWFYGTATQLAKLMGNNHIKIYHF